MTLARNEQEAAYVSEAVAVLSSTGVPVFIEDSGSLPQFVSRLQRMPNVHLREQNGNLVRQIRESIGRAAASGAEVVIYTEPDKRSFFETGLRPLIDGARENADAAVVIAARDKESLATFPAGQRRIETLFNELAAEFLGPAPDLLYGPLALRPELVMSFIDAAPDDLGWGWRPYVIARCINNSCRITVHERYFACPERQRGEDDVASRRYRLKQFAENVRGLQEGLGADAR